MIAERRDSKTPSTPSTFARLKSITCLTQQDEDMFGNIFLHHAFASGSPDVIIIQKSLKDAPDGAKIKNQFGRIPLHYALDRTKVNMECFYLLLKVSWISGLLYYFTAETVECSYYELFRDHVGISARCRPGR